MHFGNVGSKSDYIKELRVALALFAIVDSVFRFLQVAPCVSDILKSTAH